MKKRLLQVLLLPALAGCSLLSISRLPGAGFAVVAYAEYLPDHPIDTSHIGMGGRTLAAFRVKEVLLGNVTNNIVLMEYYTNCAASCSLPADVILVGTDRHWFYSGGGRGTLGAYWPPGGEPASGILPNTSASRRLVANSLGTLLRNPSSAWIVKATAESVAATVLREGTPTYSDRYTHGWIVHVEGKVRGTWCTVFVGDDGRVKDVIPGL